MAEDAPPLEPLLARGDLTRDQCALQISADLRDGGITEDRRTVTLTPPRELPSISVPFGQSADGMPTGLHIAGPKGSDARLLQLARSIERALQS